MTYAVNLYFNEEAENYIMGIWRSLDSMEKGKCLTCYDGRPHITLAIYEDLDVELAKERLKSLVREIASFRLKFLQIGIFPHNKGAIFLAPNLTDELFKIHRIFHNLFKDYDGQGWDYYKPQAWYPHCTLSMETPTEAIPSVLAEVLKVFSPIDVTIRSIGIVSLDPINYLFEVELDKF
ncbi:2'-5' RNA ligase family protein [Desulfotomaculum defluvii]